MLLGSPLILLLAAATPARADEMTPPAPTAVHLNAKNAIIHLDDRSTVQVAWLTGWMVPRPGKAVSLDDPHSFTLRIDGGETSLTAADLTRLFNQQVLPTAITSVHTVQCSFDHGSLIIRGTAHRMVSVSFVATATVRASREGHLLIHTTSLRGDGLLSSGLMRAMKATTASILKPGPHAHFRVDGDDLDLPLSALFPPPATDGHLTAVRISGDRLTQTFGPASDMPPPPSPAHAYIYFRGGTMRFGKLTMKDVDLQLVNKDNASSVDFSVAHYYHQLEAGFSKALPDRGLLVYMGGGSAVAAGH